MTTSTMINRDNETTLRIPNNEYSDADYWCNRYNSLLQQYQFAVANQIKGFCKDCERNVYCVREVAVTPEHHPITQIDYCSAFASKAGETK